MNKEYLLLKQGGLHKGSKYWSILILVFFAVGWISLLKAQDFATPQAIYMTTADNSTKLEITQNSKLDISYILNGEKMTKLPSPPRTIFNMNSKEQLFTLGGVSLLLISFVLYLLVNPNYYLLIGKILNRRKYKILPLPSIENAPNGIISVRSWTYSKGLLNSIAKNAHWQGAMVRADELPIKGNFSGIYAYRLGTDYDEYDFTAVVHKVWGIVSLTGKCVGHSNGIIRANNCTILALITKKEKVAQGLREHYSCPVIVSPKPVESIRRWMLSNEGIFWLQNNNKVINQGIGNMLDKEIEGLESYKEFKESMA